jgi:asparagine synthetase B (glutamine-hydrolysing)|tara:strand:+ start:198 stop:839 length:642 start_codon:yes stop_codon:yes gene_type:complete
MCAVVGAYSKDKVNLESFQRVIVQSMIRGKHASGIAWNDNGKLAYRVISESANFLEFKGIETNMIIGHARYSTSDLNYNQPITSNKIAIVHNGVISQENPDTWKAIYGYDFKTRNDSEIILRSYENNKHPLHLTGSMSTIILDLTTKPTMFFFRNEQRPLYYSTDDGIFVASTKNILERSGFEHILKTESCVEYRIDDKFNKENIRQSKTDLQ